LGINQKKQAGFPKADLGISPTLIHGLITFMKRKRRKRIIAFCAYFSLPLNSPDRKSQGEGRKKNQRKTPLVGFWKIHEPHPIFVYFLIYFKYMALISFPGQVKKEVRQSQVIPTR